MERRFTALFLWAVLLLAGQTFCGILAAFVEPVGEYALAIPAPWWNQRQSASYRVESTNWWPFLQRRYLCLMSQILHHIFMWMVLFHTSCIYYNCNTYWPCVQNLEVVRAGLFDHFIRTMIDMSQFRTQFKVLDGSK